MSIPRVKPGGWAVNETLTSDQITFLDQQVADRALDKTAAGDTLSGIITVAAACGFLFTSTSFAHFQSGSGPLFDNGSFVAFASGATVNLTAGFSGASIVAASNIGWTINGPTTHAGAVTLSGPTTVSGQMTLSGTNKIGLTSRSLERMAKAMMQNEDSLATDPNKLLVGANEVGDQKLDLPNGATLTDVRVGLHGFGPPPSGGGKNQVKIFKTDLLGNVTPLGSLATDPTTSGTYAGAHKYLFAANGGGALSEVIDNTQYRYFASLIGETGTGAQDTFLYGFTGIFSTTSMDDGAS